jgi:hypothetical protein
MRLAVFVLGAVVCVFSAPASAQTVSLTLRDALARARDQAPDVIVARARVAETRGRLVGGRPRFRENPTPEVFAGPRTSSGTSTDLEIGVS